MQPLSSKISGFLPPGTMALIACVDDKAALGFAGKGGACGPKLDTWVEN